MSILTASANSGLSALSYGSSSVTDHVDLNVVDEIIERAPRSARDFPPVLQAYNQVLPENGVSPVQDTIYYQFLLKLGTIRASTYGERWDIWKATNHPRHASVHHSTATERTQSFAADVKSRLPFLASASSDLDEGFAPDVGMDDTSIASRQADISVVQLLRPSPRKSMAREKSRSAGTSKKGKSLVGYTPSQSIDYDLMTLNPPIRTSTPVNVQAGLISPPLPPYSVSDVSQVLDTTSTNFDDRHERERSETPRPVSRGNRWEGRERSGEEVDDMERIADGFYQTGLLGRCMDVWVSTNRWFQETTRQIDMVRDRVLLRQNLVQWQKMAILSAREKQFAAKCGDRQKTICLTCWRAATSQRQTSRWEADMRKREVDLVLRREARLTRSTFGTWHHRAKEMIDGRQADIVLRRNALQSCLRTWVRKTMLQRDLRGLQDRQTADVLKVNFRIWRYQAQLRRAENITRAARQQTLLRGVFMVWRGKTAQAGVATAMSHHRIAKNVFSRWRNRLDEHNQAAVMASIRYRHRLLQDTFRTWNFASQGHRVQRAIDGVSVGQKLARWRSRYREIIDLAQLSTSFQGKRDVTFTSSVLSEWREKTGRLQTQALRADLASDARIIKSAFTTWTRRTDVISTNHAKALAFKVFFTQKRALKLWGERLEERKRDVKLRQQAAYVKAKRLEELKRAFDTWRSWSTYTPRDNAAVIVIGLHSDKKLKRRTLHKWMNRVIHLKAREFDVVETRNTELVRDMFSRWQKLNERVRDNTVLMQSFREVKEEDTLRGYFRAWSAAAKIARQRREALDRSLQAKEGHTLADAFDNWRAKFKERRLAGIEMEVSRRHEDALMFRVWDRWLASSLEVRVLILEKKRLKKLVWSTWRSELDWARKAADVSLPRDGQILQEAFEIWREALSTKMAKTARTRRIRPAFIPPVSETLQKRVSSGSVIPPRPPTSQPPLALRQPDPRSTPPGPRRRSNSQKMARFSMPAPAEQPKAAPSIVSEPAYGRRQTSAGQYRESSAGPTGGSRRTSHAEKPSSGSGSSSELLRALRGTLGR